MIIATFYEPLDPNKRDPLVDLWSEVWRNKGHEPVVLDMTQASQHPRFGQVLAKANSLPTVNLKQFEVYCYLRWCAIAYYLSMRQEGARAAFLDYDVFPRQYFEFGNEFGFVNYDKRGGPGFVVGRRNHYELAIDWILAKEYSEDETHVSDMTVFKEFGKFDMLLHQEVNYGVAGWNCAPLVHFGNAYLEPKDQFWNRAAFVKDVMGY